MLPPYTGMFHKQEIPPPKPTWILSTGREHVPGDGAASRADGTLQNVWGSVLRRRKWPDFELCSLFWAEFGSSSPPPHPQAKLKLLLPVGTQRGDAIRAIETKRQLKKHRYNISTNISGLKTEGKILVMKGWELEQDSSRKRGNKNLISDVSRIRKQSCLQSWKSSLKCFATNISYRRWKTGIAQTQLRRTVLALWAAWWQLQLWIPDLWL